MHIYLLLIYSRFFRTKSSDSLVNLNEKEPYFVKKGKFISPYLKKKSK